jgi:hypothetical protein
MYRALVERALKPVNLRTYDLEDKLVPCDSQIYKSEMIRI